MHLQEDAPRVFVLDDTTAPMVPKVVTTVTETVDEEESRRQAEETSKKGGGCFSRWWQPRKFLGKQLILGENNTSSQISNLGGGNSHIVFNFLMFTPKIGEDEAILTSIFFQMGYCDVISHNSPSWMFFDVWQT